MDLQGLSYRPAYFTGMRKTSPGSQFTFEVTKDDSVSFGLTSVIVVEPNEDGKRKKSGRVILFSPFTLTSHQVHDDCGELQVGRIHDRREYPLTDERVEMLANVITKNWKTYCRLGMIRDYTTAADILRRFGRPIPEDRPVVKETNKSEPKTHGKHPNDELIKPVGKETKRGKVLAYFLEDGKTVMEAMGAFGATRSGILTHLHGLWRDHGIGYALRSDKVTIELPKGCNDPFGEADETPKPKTKAPPKNKAEEAADAAEPEAPPKKRGKGGHNKGQKREVPHKTREEQVKQGGMNPLPAKGKRREVAILALKGWVSLAMLCEKVGCSLGSLRSHLHDLRTMHGLDHEMSTDKKTVRLIVPKGWKPDGGA